MPKGSPGQPQAAYIALQTGFGEKQGRARKIAGIMRWLAPFIVVVHPPVGPAALLAIILVGAATRYWGWPTDSTRRRSCLSTESTAYPSC